MFKYIAAVALFFLIGQSASAQIFSGKVLEDKTRITLNGVMIQNLNTKQTVTSGNDGRFSINAKVGDLLLFHLFQYRTDTLLLTKLNEQEVFLVPQVNLLNTVTVTSTTTKNASGALYHDKDYHGQMVANQVDANGDAKGGAILRMSYWKKDEKKKQKLADEMQRDQTRDEIAKVFTPEVVGKYVPLKGDDMKAFLIRYTPDAKTYKSADFNMALYLNACYKKFMALTPEERKPQDLQ